MMVGMVATLGLVGLGGMAGAQDDAPSIKKVMGQLHKGQKALLPSIQAQLKTESPNWGDVKKASTLIVDLAGALPSLEPPKGEKGSYAKLSKAYLASAKNLKDAADAEDLDKSRASAKKLGGTCKTCHAAHKGM
jgi:cytochrome c556